MFEHLGRQIGEPHHPADEPVGDLLASVVAEPMAMSFPTSLPEIVPV